ncbi:MAG: hypothetical protein HKN74_04335, partial [Acidimicrobiia bacterium]|nr:hypothetical protein [Acidimicrobiia bacterium]
MTQTTTSPTAGPDGGPAPAVSLVRELVGRISRVELIVGGGIAAIMGLLVLIEPDILEAPFENGQTLLFTFGGTALAGAALVTMLWLRVPPVVRLIVLVVPFAIVNWWLISPYFIDDTVDEGFSTSISQQLGAGDEQPGSGATDDQTTTNADSPTTTAPPTDSEPATPDPADDEEPPAEPSGPVLLGAGEFVGLAGHDGTGDAGLFQNPDGSLLLRFENFDIQNGPDLEVYLVPGPDQTSLADGSIHLGPLK